ncbi:Calmodulin-binding receptor-like cytoplasmic kinase 3 [Nymphaea thermarum]|nr:Calmodulin-binding receptor-like cytoplasmic kinase 3 [Nymphaea thermarum]
MLAYALALFLLGQLFCSFANGYRGCDDGDRISWWRPRECGPGWRNGEDSILFCRELEFLLRNGCFSSSEMEEWWRLGQDCCGFSGSNPRGNVARIVARKELLFSRNEGFHRSNLENVDTAEVKHSDVKTVAAAVSGIFLLSCSILCPCLRARRKDAHAVLPKDHSTPFDSSLRAERPPGSPLRAPPSPLRLSRTPELSRVGSIRFSIGQIIRATNNFAPTMKIGDGGSATVYKGVLADGRAVAVKRAKQGTFENLQKEFSTEIETLTNVEHRSLVKLIGFVDEDNESIIVSEYVPNGTLREHLDGLNGKSLDFAQRLEISIDVAHALTYLHVYSGKPIIHCDIKSSNILLTENLRAKVADFGFARAGPTNEDETHISTKVKGTAGYLDPEYVKTYRLTTKSDVFSYGILLLEIFSGRRPVEVNRPANERITVRWAFQLFNERKLLDILDPSLESPGPEILHGLFRLAFNCAAPIRSDRPTMEEAQKDLWSIRREYNKILRSM